MPIRLGKIQGHLRNLIGKLKVNNSFQKHVCDSHYKRKEKGGNKDQGRDKWKTSTTNNGREGIVLSLYNHSSYNITLHYNYIITLYYHSSYNSNQNLLQIILYGHEKLSLDANKKILEATLKYIQASDNAFSKFLSFFC